MRTTITLLLAVGTIGLCGTAGAQVPSGRQERSVAREPYPGLSLVTPPPHVSVASERNLAQKADQTGALGPAQTRQPRRPRDAGEQGMSRPR